MTIEHLIEKIAPYVEHEQRTEFNGTQERIRNTLRFTQEITFSPVNIRGDGRTVADVQFESMYRLAQMILEMVKDG